ncbi:23S rRNA (guanosine(2251)-2'-O)-methyltransferase RlmB [Nocardioides lentus]|uniref:23S rRNA (Guanosine(2251)-2'-O)-methyltransferase RlmB n=1 Tax=Nocardioides lentus TaxID=338077 RepID=A0ABN2PAU3_9ACTN
MAGNSQRRGATRKSSKAPTAGSGGRVRRGLEGKGPTPKAKDRPNHKAYAAAKGPAASSTSSQKGGGRGSRGPAGKSRRDGTEAEWIAGRNPVVEALRADLPITGLYVADGAERDGRMREAFALAADKGLSLNSASRADLDRLTNGAVHQGLAARLPPYSYAHPEDLLGLADEADEPALIVALDSVTDPRNLGAVVRSAAAFGAHGVVVPERRAAGMTASAWKTSAGAAARVPVARATNLVRTLKEYADAGCMIVGLAGDGGPEGGPDTVDLPGLELADGPLVLVVGAEDDGLARLTRETCDQLVRIPMAPGVESLNAGVAAGVALYEIARLRSA